jgi:hypothetical protein
LFENPAITPDALRRNESKALKQRTNEQTNDHQPKDPAHMHLPRMVVTSKNT